MQDETLTLFSLGIASFIEVLSGIGILVMVLRICRNLDTSRSRFEPTVLRVMGASFYLLSVGLGLMRSITCTPVISLPPRCPGW